MKKRVFDILNTIFGIIVISFLTFAIIYINGKNPSISQKVSTFFEDSAEGSYIFDMKDRYKAFPYQDKAVVLGNKTLFGFDANCNELFLHNVTYSNPQIAISGKYILVYDFRGTDLMIIEDGNIIRNTKTQDPIITATINKNGHFAVACDHIGFKGLVTVYDKNEKEFYKWYSVENYIIGLELSKDGRKMAVSTLKTEGGQARGGLLFFDLSKQNPESEFLSNEGVYLLIRYIDDGLFYAVGDKDTAVFDKYHMLKWQIDYDNKTLKQKSLSDTGMLVLGFDDKNKGTSIEVYNKNNEMTANIKNDGKINFLQSYKNSFLICDGRRVFVYLNDGKLYREKNIGKDISSLVFINQNKGIFVTTQNAQTIIFDRGENE